MMQGLGGPSGYKPWRAKMSAKFRPAAFTRISTSPGAGTGSGRVSTFITPTSPLRVVTIARIGISIGPFVDSVTFYFRLAGGGLKLKGSEGATLECAETSVYQGATVQNDQPSAAFVCGLFGCGTTRR